MKYVYTSLNTDIALRKSVDFEKNTYYQKTNKEFAFKILLFFILEKP